MRILAISGDFSIGGLCYRFSQAGHEVKVYIADPAYNASYINMLNIVSDWQAELEWVGKDGLILFDTTDFGAKQNELRNNGYAVLGGSEAGDRCENDREYGQKIMSDCGISTLPTFHFTTPEEAIAYIRKNPNEWVIKKDGDASMIFNYIGAVADGSDCIGVLKTYATNKALPMDSVIVLQERVHGVEIGIARYFNGNDWVGPIEFNIEHKDLCTGNLGPKTWEMGTLMWFDENEQNTLYQATLAKMKEYLKSIDFRGDIDINCIVNEDTIAPLELTMRFGFPALQLQATLSDSPFEEFLMAVATGQSHNLTYKKEYGVVVLVAVPPFPYDISLGKDSLKGSRIIFREPLTPDEFSRINFEDVAKDTEGNYFIAAENGFVLHVSGHGETVTEARNHADALIKKINIPKMFYRTDIGLKFMQEDEQKLREWGWL